MKRTELNFECTHETDTKSMTCSWAGGKIQLITYFESGITGYIKDGDVKETYDDLTIEQFMNLQITCQTMANDLTKKPVLYETH